VLQLYGEYSSILLQSMIQHKFRPFTTLDLRNTSFGENNNETINAALRECCHYHHLMAPRSLSTWESSEPSFASNHNFHSLTIVLERGMTVSRSLLRGIQHNDTLHTLCLEMDADKFKINCRSLCRLALANNRTLKNLSINIQAQEDEKSIPNNLMEQLTAELFPYVSTCGLSHVNVKIGKSTLVSSKVWDDAIAPYLSLNWYHQQQQRINLFDGALLGITLDAINHGVVSDKTTNQLVANHIPAKYSLMYDVVRNHVPHFISF
jgi:hypothetical protein